MVNGYAATWTRGKLTRLSKSSTTSGTQAYSYSYNALGQRVDSSYTYTPSILNGSAIAAGELTNYNKTFRYDQSGRLICESKTSQYYGELDSSEHIVYLYDGSSIIGMQYSGSSAAGTYYFQRNLLGDVIGIYDTSGAKVAGYAYDAWGNCTITLNANGIATKNPIRYRGYYYDQESGLYYLNARYYNPAWRRFISPDDTAYLDPDTPNGLNLYTYCNNDPINYADPSGNDPKWWQWALFGIGVALIAVAAGMAFIGTGGIGAFGMGALIGSIALGSVGAVAGGAIGYATGGVDGILGGAMAGFGIGAIVGFVVGGTIGYYNSLVQVDIRKFTNYVLDPTNSKGKHTIFKNLGYDKSNAKSLARIYKRQGLKNFLTKNYVLGKADLYGQRITMGIKIGDTILKTGWMLQDNGIRLITPFSGFWD